MSSVTMLKCLGRLTKNAVSMEAELAYATLRTTLRYVCYFGENYATELRYVLFCYVSELRTFFLNKRSCLFTVLLYVL